MNRIAALLHATTLATAIAIGPAPALADERPYAFTYEPVVSAEGERELELYETLHAPRSGLGSERSWEHQLELGYGVTDRLSISGYGVFRSTGQKVFEASAVKLEGRYKLLDASRSPVEVVLYLEGEKEVVDDKPWGVEEKLILGRTSGRLGWVVNLVAGQEWPAGGGREIKWGWSAGSAYRLNETLRLGAEIWGARTRDGAGAVSWEAFAGPTGVVTLPSGPFNSAWLIVGAGFGLRQENDRLQARVVLGADR